MPVGIALLCLAWAGQPATATTTDQQKWDAAIAKLAVPLGSFPGKLGKVFCVCNTTFLAGQLETFGDTDGAVGVQCTVYSFNPDGSTASIRGCNDFTVVGK